MRMASRTLCSRVSAASNTNTVRKTNIYSCANKHLQLLKLHVGLYSEVLLKWRAVKVCCLSPISVRDFSSRGRPDAVPHASSLRCYVYSKNASDLIIFSIYVQQEVDRKRRTCFPKRELKSNHSTQKWHPWEVPLLFDSVSWRNANGALTENSFTLLFHDSVESLFAPLLQTSSLVCACVCVLSHDSSHTFWKKTN